MTNKQIYRSPLFYVGDKYKLLKEIKPLFPKTINRFIEPFTGGGSVFLNVDANEFLLNDIDNYVFKIHQFLISQSKNTDLFFNQIKNTILEYGFSRSYIENIVPKELRKEFVNIFCKI